MENTIEKKAFVESAFKAGAHYGYARTRRHPSVKPYIFGAKNNTEIIDLEKSFDLFETAMAFVRKLGSEGKQIVFVGNKTEAKQIVHEGAAKIGMPVTLDRWIGGTLTNFPEIKKRIARLEDLRQKRATGALNVYTKKERINFDKDIAKLERFFGGMTELKGLPAAMFVVDPRKEHTALREALRMNVPVIALAGSDCDITLLTYPLVANDAARSSITFVVNEIVRAYEEGKRMIPTVENTVPPSAIV
ncbi:MAG: 30S ribosomal protein S2 [Patescibacteria group bacterium]|mgnify:CR=1 FL=1